MLPTLSRALFTGTVTAAAVLTAPTSSAAVLDAVVSDDAWVQADGQRFNDNRLRVRDDASPGNVRKSFIEFTLPALPAGEVINSATFSVFDLETESGKNLGVSNERIVQVFGVTDESVEGFDEATVTYANAPGNAADGSSAAPAATTLLGTLDIGASQTANQARSLSNAALADFLSSDTNGTVTFALVSTDNNGMSTISFGSSENATISGPALSVVTVVPEPATTSLLAAGGLLALRRRR